MKRMTLDGLVRERVLLAAADKLHLVTTRRAPARAVHAATRSSPPLRNPDGSVNKRRAGGSQGMSSGDVRGSGCARTCPRARCCRRGRHRRSRRPAPAPAALDALFAAARGAGACASTPRTTRPRSTPSDAELEAYYKDPAHAAQFQAPEQASDRVRRARPGRAEEGHRRLRGGPAQVLRRERGALHRARGAPRQPHPDQGRQGRAGGRAREGQGQGRGAARRGEARTRRRSPSWRRRTPTTRARPSKRRRPRLLRPRRDGQALRGRGVRAQAGRDQRRRRDRLRLPHHPGDRRARRREAQLRRRCAPRSRTRSSTSWRRSSSPRRRTSSPTWSTSSPTA